LASPQGNQLGCDTAGLKTKRSKKTTDFLTIKCHKQKSRALTGWNRLEIIEV
jgi:hypothetical protein